MKKVVPSKFQPLPPAGNSSSSSSSSSRAEKLGKVISSPPMVAGVPVLELIRKLEDEKILSRNDRAIVNDILNDLSLRDNVVKIFRDIELASNRAMSIKRLRNVIKTYRDGGYSKQEMVSKNEKSAAISM